MKDYKTIDVCALTDKELEGLKVELLKEDKTTVVDYLTFLIDEKVPYGEDELKINKESIANIVDLIKDPRFKSHLEEIVPPDKASDEKDCNCSEDCGCDTECKSEE